MKQIASVQHIAMDDPNEKQHSATFAGKSFGVVSGQNINASRN